MMANRISILLLAASLGACSSLSGLVSSTDDESRSSATEKDTDSVASVEDSQLSSGQVILAAGDKDLVRVIERRDRGETVSDAEARTGLDGSIDPELKDQAEQARNRLDSEEDGVSGTEDPQADENLWVRLRGMFALDHDVDSRRVERQIEWYQEHPSYVKTVVERGSRYLHYIVTEVEDRGLPGEMALLPIVESAFDPFAYSHGRASGMWQFIPGTGKYLGLEQNWWHDQRRDVIASTDAALTYLERLADRFDGDYNLALASYNSGAGTVLNARKRNRNAGKSVDYWALNLPTETRLYVPKLIALAKIFDDPDAYGIELPPLDDKPYFEMVDTGSQIDLSQAAELAGVDMDEIYLLNPAYNRWATAPDGPHRLLVPVANAEKFREGLAGIDENERVSWRDYTVKSGDSLIRIARQFNTTPGVIQQVNNISGSVIRAGDQLLIPTAKRGTRDYALSESQRLARTQAGSGNNQGNRVEHRVRSGDTFWDIAREHGVSVRQVARWNNMAPGDPIRPGQKLVVWSEREGARSLGNSREDMVRRVGYRVRQGDSLAAIANRFSVNVSDIADWNDLNTARYLQPGQSLVLYVDVRNSP